MTTTETETLADRFEPHRKHLTSVAYRMLGSQTEAADAVQEAFVHVLRGGADGVDNFSGWLTTVVGRVCLDVLRKRKSRREVPVDTDEEQQPATDDDPERRSLHTESVGAGLLIVLETLRPAERVAFVLHDLFSLSFEEVACVLGRSPMAARQLASRARRRVQGNGATHETDPSRQRELVAAFLTASQTGDLSALLAILDPDVVLRADAEAVNAAARANVPGIADEVRGQNSVANIFRGRARAAQPALVDGFSGLVFAPGGVPRVVVDFVVENARILEISMIGEPERLAALALTF